MIWLNMKNNNIISTEKLQNVSSIIWKSWNVDKYKYRASKEILASNQRQVKGKAKFASLSLSRAFEKETITIENQAKKQIKALEEHEKQLFESSCWKESLTFLKQKLANKRMDKI